MEARHLAHILDVETLLIFLGCKFAKAKPIAVSNINPSIKPPKRAPYSKKRNVPSQSIAAMKLARMNNSWNSASLGNEDKADGNLLREGIRE
ncbi:hypothetical protein GJ496_005547 [Pomphorhynchus laevis]|nr:hypothetical protein GJ496_005547 [Pomphorhynchus laevis]